MKMLLDSSYHFSMDMHAKASSYMLLIYTIKIGVGRCLYWGLLCVFLKPTKAPIWHPHIFQRQMQRNSFVLFCIFYRLTYLLENLLPWQQVLSVLHKNSPLCWRMMLVTGGWVNVYRDALSGAVSQHSIV